MRVSVFRLSCVLLLAVLLGALSACTPAPAPPPSAQSIVVRDALGREVHLPSAPKRVAALLGSFADVWALAGGEVCAAPADAWEDFGLELPHAVNIGGAHSPALELILSSDPDLVLASASTASHVDMLDVLEAAGITVVFFEVDNFADYLAMLDTCTDMTGRKDLYEQNGLAVLAQIEAVKAAYAAEPLDEGERTVLLLRASSGSVKAKGSRGTILGEMLADMGCVNIADNDGTLLDQLSVEAVIREDPRHIFVVAMGDHTAAEASLHRMIAENPAWGTLPALREGRLHVMDKTLFNLKPNDRWGEAYRILYEILVEN